MEKNAKNGLKKHHPRSMLPFEKNCHGQKTQMCCLECISKLRNDLQKTSVCKDLPPPPLICTDFLLQIPLPFMKQCCAFTKIQYDHFQSPRKG